MKSVLTALHVTALRIARVFPSMECQKPKKKENISLPTFYMVIHFLYCI